MGLNYVFYSPVVAIHGANFTSGKLLRGCDGVRNGKLYDVYIK